MSYFNKKVNYYYYQEITIDLLKEEYLKLN